MRASTGGVVRLRDAKPAQAGSTPAPPSITLRVCRETYQTEGGFPVKFARTFGGVAAVCSVGIVLAMACDHLAALLDAALAF